METSSNVETKMNPLMTIVLKKNNITDDRMNYYYNNEILNTNKEWIILYILILH